MKTLKFLILILLVSNIALAAKPSSKVQYPGTLTLTQIEVLSTGESRECHSGGIGASACEISAGIRFDIGVSGGCKVECKDGYYACCNFYCECKKEP